MDQSTEYAQLLRAIGQALEVLNFGTFEMEFDSEGILVRGGTHATERQREGQRARRNLIKYVWENLPGKAVSPAEMQVAVSTWPSQIELRYTPKDVDRLDREGKAKRQNPGASMDVAGLSQLLRTIGAYAEHKRARLLKITRHRDSLVIRYETDGGQSQEETVSAASLYDFWVHTYLHRKGRVE